MGTLEAVLAYKAKKDAEDQADIQAIPQALAAFQAGREQARKSHLEQIQLQMAIQKFGLEQQKAPFEIAKLKGDVSKLPFETEKLQAETSKSKAEAGILNKFISGEQGFGGGVVTGGNIGGFQFEMPEVKGKILSQQEEIKNRADASKALDEYSSNASEALTAIDKIESKAKDLGDFKRGFGQQILEKGKMAAREFSEEKTVNAFKQALAQEMSPLVRKLAEEKGPLTDKDIDRAIEGVGGKLTRPFEDKKVALDDLRDKVRSAVVAKAQAAGVSDADIEKKYPDLHKKLFGSFEILIDPDGVQRKVSKDKVNSAIEAGFKRGK